ncbi:hypothetical protein ACFY3J_09425 [Streptomyces sp. NPDC001231]|uniref:hypothetical protein n=1 Tax=unclassified Streptomyces TaxID=2593676 RepID=UPI00368D4E9A
MSGRADSETHPGISGADDVEAAGTEDHAEGDVDVGEDGAVKDDGTEGDDGTKSKDGTEGEDGAEDEVEDPAEVARRARWTAAGAGALLTLAGLAASLLRLSRSASALVPVAYAAGAAVCAVATFIGSRGRTRRALWLMIAGVMVMALGDQLD